MTETPVPEFKTTLPETPVTEIETPQTESVAHPAVAEPAEEIPAEPLPIAEPTTPMESVAAPEPVVPAETVSEASSEPEPEMQTPVETAPEPEPKPVAVVREVEPAAAPKKAEPAAPAPVAAEPVPAEPEESFADIFSEFQRTHQRREPGGGQIRGTVVAVTADSVLVDIGYKSEGILPLAAFPVSKETGLPAVKPGDSLQVSVKGRDEDGYYQLSLFRTAVPKDWTSLERAFEQKSTIVGTVTAVVKGGLHVDVGVKAFLPASRSGARDAAEMEKLIGEEIRVRITKLDVADEDVVIDRRVVTEEEALESKARRYAEVAEGAVMDGTVRSLTDYGAFVDLGGVDGLLHISDIAWTRISKSSDVLTVGQQIEVKVLKIDPETRKISLGLKQLQAHPWDAVAETFALGDKVRGTVTRIADFGAFVEIAPGVEGLIHISEMSYTKRILKATEVVHVGDNLEAVILGISLAERRISLGLKQTLGDPWVEAAARLAPGSIVEGPVASMQKFGAFIQVAEGVEGMVHISEIVLDRRLNHPSDVLRVGERVKAMVLDVDKEKRQLRLSIKQLIPTSLDEFLAEHHAGDSVTGRVISVDAGVAKVELGEGVIALCTLPVPVAAEPEAPAAVGKVDLSAFSSMLKTKWKTGAPAPSAKAAGPEEVKPGQVRNFRIATMEAASKLIDLELSK